MANEMIERVARAIAEKLEACGALPKAAKTAQDPWAVGPCMLAARAAIEAMREPTDAMSEAGANTPVGHAWRIGGEFIVDPDSIWEAMIEKAMT